MFLHKDAARQHLKIFSGSSMGYLKKKKSHRLFFNKILFEKRIKLGFCQGRRTQIALLRNETVLS